MTDTLKRIDGHQDEGRNMTTNTATTETHPRFGSIESLADILRPRHHGVDYIPIEGVIQGLLDSSASAEEKLIYIRNALTAAEKVRAELAAR